MSDRDPRDEARSGEPDRSGDGIAALLKATGRRPPVPLERAARVRAAALAEWRRVSRRRAGRRAVWWAASLTAAAALVVAALLGIDRGDGRAAERHASTTLVERAGDDVWARSTEDDRAAHPVRLSAGDRIESGTEIATTERGRVALALDTGASVRLDVHTRVRLLADRVFALDDGAIYVSSRGAGTAPGGSIEIRTPFATLRNVGTQFEARLLDASLVVRVRDGSVAVRSRGAALEVAAGHELEIRGDGGSEQREVEDAEDTWSWIQEITPMMQIEGRTLREFADWVARERGLRVRFADGASASEITLNGSIRDLTLDQALESVLATCGMSYRIEGQFLILERRRLGD